ncbi:Spy/CpxP family protein refolding chaperone [Lysobacter tyrosinilyticus]
MNTNSSTTSRPGAIRALAFALALVAGVGTLYVATTPKAEAAASLAQVASNGGLLAHLHGQDHAAMHDHFQKVLDEVGTDPAQKQQIQTIVRRAMDDQHADLRRYHDSMTRLKTLLTAPGIDLNAVDAVRTEQEQLAAATSRRITDTALAVAKVLTPAQRQKLGTALDQMLASHIGHHAG